MQTTRLAQLGRLAILIPAYNEERTLGQVLRTLPKKLPRVQDITPVVINDGSRDQTAAIAAEEGAVVISHLINRGQGAALRTGFEYALAHDYEVVVTFDADGQHNPNEISSLLEPILNQEADVVLGSRFLSKKAVNMPTLRLIVLKGGIVFTRLISGIRVTDTHNGFRALHRSALAQLKLNQDKMEHASEILDQVAQHRLAFREVPVTIEYSDYTGAKGQSNGNAFKIALKILIYKLVK